MIKKLIQQESKKLENQIVNYRKEGMTTREIAEKLEVPQGTLDDLIKRCTQFNRISEIDTYIKENIDSGFKLSPVQESVKRQWENGVFQKEEYIRIPEEDKINKRQELIDLRKSGMNHKELEKYFRVTSAQFRKYMVDLGFSGLIHIDNGIKEIYPTWRKPQRVRKTRGNRGNVDFSTTTHTEKDKNPTFDLGKAQQNPVKIQNAKAIKIQVNNVIISIEF